jgi:nucleoside-diphosphate-sugar epimerase
LTILLTGSTGFLGSRIAEELRSRNLAWRPLRARLEQTRPPDLEGASTVIPCAGLTPARDCRDEDFFEVNAAGTSRLLEQCERCGVRRFVYISSMGVKFPSAYASSKLAAEESVKRSRLQWLVLRPAHIYGPNKQLRGTFTKLKRKMIWSVLGSGRNPIHIVYVEDCAAVVVEAALSSRARETLNIMAPEYSELDYIRTLRKVTGSKILIVPMPLFWARMRKGDLAVDTRMAGLRMPGVADWNFAAAPLETAMRRIHESLEVE